MSKATMIDEQKLRELADQFICHPVSRSITEVEEGGEAIKELLDELATLRQERTAWRVSAENAEKDAARWRHLEYMHGRGIPMETMAHYIARPDRLDYSAELHQEHAAKETP